MRLCCCCSCCNALTSEGNFNTNGEMGIEPPNQRANGDGVTKARFAILIPDTFLLKFLYEVVLC